MTFHYLQWQRKQAAHRLLHIQFLLQQFHSTNMCDIVWWSLFSDSFNSGFICSRTVNLALNRTLNCHWTNDRPFFTTSIRCKHQPLSFIWNILRSIYFKIHLDVFSFYLHLFMFKCTVLFLFVSISVLDMFFFLDHLWTEQSKIELRADIIYRFTDLLHCVYDAVQLSFGSSHVV